MWSREYTRQTAFHVRKVLGLLGELNAAILSLPANFRFELHSSAVGRKVIFHSDGKAIDWNSINGPDRDNVHELKTWPEWFESATVGGRNFEIRRYDRDFQIGDILVLKEYQPGRTGFPGGFTNREVHKRITTLMKGREAGISEGYIAMGLEEVNDGEDE